LEQAQADFASWVPGERRPEMAAALFNVRRSLARLEERLETDPPALSLDDLEAAARIRRTLGELRAKIEAGR
jgi:hypothetical protein